MLIVVSKREENGDTADTLVIRKLKSNAHFPFRTQHTATFITFATRHNVFHKVCCTVEVCGAITNRKRRSTHNTNFKLFLEIYISVMADNGCINSDYGGFASR